jgi:carbonic anhydrase
MIILSSWATAIALIATAGAAQNKQAHHWSYSGKEGPQHWADLDPDFATCKVGQHQSPIDIRNSKQSDLPAIQFDYHAAPLHIINNGHTVQVNYAPGSFFTVGDKRYELKQFHFHHRSEEQINGKNAAMVAHLVHTDASGTLAVVGVLLSPGAANQLVDTLWSHLPQQTGPEQQFDDIQTNVADLLPADRSYYTFPGSLTTPPCSENVMWFVMKKSVAISKEQASVFARIYAHNARPIQPLNDRVVVESK